MILEFVMSKSFAVFLILLLTALSASGATIHVPDDQPTIQAGIDYAVYGDTVLVGPGIYEEYVSLAEGVILLSEGGPDVTTIDGSPNDRVVYGADDATISGFTITGCWMSVDCFLCSPTVSGNIITEGFYGIYCNTSSPVISGNVITSEVSGIYSLYGSSPVISGNVITGGYEEDESAIFNSSSCSPVISGNIITGSYYGIYNYNECSPEIYNNIITGNRDGIHSLRSTPPIINNTISDNEFQGIYCFESPSEITNNIITGSLYGIYCYSSSDVIISYNNVWGIVEEAYHGCSAGPGDISEDPLFMDPAGGDYHLDVASPCIDVGTDAGVYDDIDDETRPQGYGFDMGADEYTGAGSGGLEVFLEDYPVCIEPEETLVFTAGAENTGEDSASFDYAEMVVTGPASLAKSLYSGPAFTLPPGESVSAVVSQFVPPTAPLGIYTITIAIYFEGTDISSASFDIEVAGSCD